MSRTAARDFVAEGFASGWEHVDASTLSDDRVLEADVAIVGTGAGGGTAAEILAQAGLRVVMIEEGPLRTSRDFHMREFEALADLYQEAGSRATADGAIAVYQGRMVGGGTGVNWTTCFRTPPETLRHWAAEHGLADFSVDSMRPWFERIEKRHNIHAWQVPPNENNLAIERGCRALGWSWGVVRRNVRGCQNLGYCGTACPVNAKQSTLVTTVPGALRAGAALVSRARAERLRLRGDRVDALECLAMDGTGTAPGPVRLEIRAREYVLAAGGIGTPGILLRSAAPALDPHGRAGKRTFLHPVATSVARMPTRVAGESGAPQTIYSDHWIQAPDDPTPGFKLEAMPLQPISVAGLFDVHGAAHAELMRMRPFLNVVIALQRDGFHPESVGGAVHLHPDGTPALDYPLGPYAWGGIREALLRMAELQFAAGAEQVRPVHRDARWVRSWKEARREIAALPMETLTLPLSSAHVMGGCAMGRDPRESVVDPSGRHHESANLWVFDGSIFPTSIGANPMESIFGLVARLASQLAERLVGPTSEPAP